MCRAFDVSVMRGMHAGADNACHDLSPTGNATMTVIMTMLMIMSMTMTMTMTMNITYPWHKKNSCTCQRWSIVIGIGTSSKKC